MGENSTAEPNVVTQLPPEPLPLWRVVAPALGTFSLRVYLLLLRLIAIRFSELLVGVCCLYFTVVKFIAYREDTVLLSNAFFALLASLAIMSFSFAGTLGQGHALRRRLEVAGARAFHGGVLLLLASVLKYALLHLQQRPWADDHPRLLVLCEFLFGNMAAVLFLLAALETFLAIRAISDLLVLHLLEHPLLEKMPARRPAQGRPAAGGQQPASAATSAAA